MASKKLMQFCHGHRWSFLHYNDKEERRLVSRPSDHELCVMVYQYMLEKAINHHLQSKCSGCKYNSVIQSEHEGLGCLMVWDKAIEHCMLLAAKKIEPLDLEIAYGKVLDVLEIPGIIPQHVAQDVMKTHSPRSLLKSVTARDNPLEFQEVLQLALGQCLNIFGPLQKAK